MCLSKNHSSQHKMQVITIIPIRIGIEASRVKRKESEMVKLCLKQQSKCGCKNSL